jgi:hypothetical protein
VLNDDNIKEETDKQSITKTQQGHLSEKNITNHDELQKLLLFKEMYHQATIESFEILGKQVSEVVIDYLEEKHAIQLEDTVDNPLILDQVLEDAINGGRRIVERKMIKTLNKKLKIRNNIIEPNQSDFAENILKLREFYLKRKATDY